MSPTRLWIAALVLATAVPATAEAGFGIGGRFSYLRNQGIEDNSTMLGIMARFRTQFLGLEAAIDTRNEELNDGSELRSRPVTASLMIYPLPMVYGLAGLGLYHSTLEVADGSEDTETTLGYHYGLGAEMPLVPLVKLTADLRYHFLDYEFEDIGPSLGKVDADSWAISAGVILYLK